MRTDSFRLATSDDTSIFVNHWSPDDSPRAIVLVAHGMAEHSDRYERFAQALTASGYEVYAPDHRGHGRTSAETGVDPAYMMALADKESRFDVEARNPASSAEGLFQFVTATWLEMIRDFGARHGLAAEAASVSGRGGALTIANPAARARVLGLRKDPYVAALMAAELAKRDRSRVESRIGRALRTSELYVAHFLGTASAGRFFTLSSDKPDEVAQKVFRNVARANRSLFVSGGAQKRGGKGHGRGLTVAELHERLDGMIDRRISRYEGVAALVQEAPSRVVLAEAGTP